MESAIRYICDRYIGVQKSGGKLSEGVRRLSSIRREFLPRLMARNPHELMRCLEVRNLFDVAEVHIKASLERRESRQDHERLDFPDRDPALDGKLSFQYIKDNGLRVEMRKRPELDMTLRVERE